MTFLGRDIVKMLESEARRKPAIAELLERARAGELTDAEIDEAVVPLPWYRKALKQACVRVADDNIEMVRLDDGANSQPGTTVIYRGDNCWLKPQRGMKIEVRTGDLLFFPDSGGAWMNQTFFSGAQPELRVVEIVAQQTRKDYVESYMERLANHA